MRKVIDAQMVFGETDISAIRLDLKSRDDIPRLLRGLQHIYMQPELRERVFTILEDMRPVQADGKTLVSAEKGRPGWHSGKYWCWGCCGWVSTQITIVSTI